MGPQVGLDEPAGLVGKSCRTANRGEEGNAARMRRKERLDREGGCGNCNPDGTVRGDLGAGRNRELVGQCRNELTATYDPKQKAGRTVEEKVRAFPPMGPRVDGPASDGLAGHVGIGRANRSRCRDPQVVSDGLWVVSDGPATCGSCQNLKGLRVASDGPAGLVGWAYGSRRMGLRVASDVPAVRVRWALGSRRMAQWACGSRRNLTSQRVC